MKKCYKAAPEKRHFKSYLKKVDQLVAGYKSLELTSILKEFSVSKTSIWNLRKALNAELLKETDQFKNFDGNDMRCIPIVFDEDSCQLVGSFADAVTETKDDFLINFKVNAVVLNCKVGKLLHGEVRQIFKNKMKVRVADLFQCIVTMKSKHQCFTDLEDDVKVSDSVCFRITHMGMGVGVDDFPEFKGTFKCMSKAYHTLMDEEESEIEEHPATSTTEDNKINSDASTQLMSEGSTKGGSEKIKRKTKTASKRKPTNITNTISSTEDEHNPPTPKKKKNTFGSPEYSKMLAGVIDSVIHKLDAGLLDDCEDPSTTSTSVKETSGNEKTNMSTKPIKSKKQTKHSDQENNTCIEELSTLDENENILHVKASYKKSKKKNEDEEKEIHAALSLNSDGDFQVKSKKKKKKKKTGSQESRTNLNEWINSSQNESDNAEVSNNKLNGNSHPEENQPTTSNVISIVEQKPDEERQVEKKKKKKKNKRSRESSLPKLNNSTLNSTVDDTTMNDSVFVASTTSVNEVPMNGEPTPKKKKKVKLQNMNESEMMMDTEKTHTKKKSKHKEEKQVTLTSTVEETETPKKKKKKKKDKHTTKADT